MSLNFQELPKKSPTNIERISLQAADISPDTLFTRATIISNRSQADDSELVFSNNMRLPTSSINLTIPSGLVPEKCLSVCLQSPIIDLEISKYVAGRGIWDTTPIGLAKLVSATVVICHGEGGNQFAVFKDHQSNLAVIGLNTISSDKTSLSPVQVIDIQESVKELKFHPVLGSIYQRLSQGMSLEDCRDIVSLSNHSASTWHDIGIKVPSLHIIHRHHLTDPRAF